MKTKNAWAWIVFALGALYFLVPLAATVQFSLSIRRGTLSLDAYTNVLQSPEFQCAFAGPGVTSSPSIRIAHFTADRYIACTFGSSHVPSACPKVE